MLRPPPALDHIDHDGEGVLVDAALQEGGYDVGTLQHLVGLLVLVGQAVRRRRGVGVGGRAAQVSVALGVCYRVHLYLNYPIFTYRVVMSTIVARIRKKFPSRSPPRQAAGPDRAHRQPRHSCPSGWLSC